MKKIISIFIVTLMLLTSVLAMIPISAADAKGTYTPDWAQLKNEQKYIAYDKNGNEFNLVDYHNQLTTTRESNLLSANRKASGGEVSYISTVYFKITSTTKYEYDVMVQSHQTNRYAGVPFAISTDNKVYFLYGAFNNKNDSDDVNYPNYSYAIGAHGGYENKCTSSNDQANPKFFQKAELDSEGFATLRFIYDGLTVTVMIKNSSGSYVQIGDRITLASGSKIAMGIYSRNGDKNNNRTVGIKNAVVTGLNSEAVDYMKNTGVNVELENDTPKEPEIIETPGDFDSTELEEIVEEANELNEIEYEPISYKMLMNAVAKAEELICSDTATQSEIDEMVAMIRERINGLQPSGVEVESEEEADEGKENSADASADNANAAQPAAPTDIQQTGAAVATKKISCKSSVATTAAIVALVGTFGTALVIKKKD